MKKVRLSVAKIFLYICLFTQWPNHQPHIPKENSAFVNTSWSKPGASLESGRPFILGTPTILLMHTNRTRSVSQSPNKVAFR